MPRKKPHEVIRYEWDYGLIEDTFEMFIEAYFDGVIDEDALIYFFHCLYEWGCIPKGQLCWHFIGFLSQVAEEWRHTKLLQPSVVSIIADVFSCDTVDNPALIDLLDRDGYLTVYYGRPISNDPLRDCHIWWLNLKPAIQNARFRYGMRTGCNHISDFCGVTGKVKLNDVIAFNENFSGGKIIVLSKNVKRRKKAYYRIINGELSSLNSKEDSP
jgi:hypothetical protein